MALYSTTLTSTVMHEIRTQVLSAHPQCIQLEPHRQCRTRKRAYAFF